VRRPQLAHCTHAAHFHPSSATGISRNGGTTQCAWKERSHAPSQCNRVASRDETPSAHPPHRRVQPQ
jgi:hypothetical protein